MVAEDVITTEEVLVVVLAEEVLADLKVEMKEVLVVLEAIEIQLQEKADLEVIEIHLQEKAVLEAIEIRLQEKTDLVATEVHLQEENQVQLKENLDLLLPMVKNVPLAIHLKTDQKDQEEVN